MSNVTSSYKQRLTSSFRKARVIAPIHTAGPIAISHDARYIVTCVQEEVLLTDVQTGIEICRFQGDTTSVTSLCISPFSKHLIVFASSNSLRIYDLPLACDPLQKPVPPLRRIPRAHDAPVHVSTVDPSSSYVASGSADGVVKVWDLHRGYLTHVFKGHGGVVSALAFHHRSVQDIGATATFLLFTGSVDNRIRIFDLACSHGSPESKPHIVLEGHVSVPRGIAVSNDGRWLVSGGRDAVALIWDLAAVAKGKRALNGPFKTIPTLERVEAVGILEYDEESNRDSPLFTFYTGGEHGSIKIWDAWEGSIIASMTPQHTYVESDEENEDEQREILDVIYLPVSGIIVSLHADQNIVFYSLATRTLIRQIIGYNDEITDAVLMRPSSSPKMDSHLALATNSSLIRLYSIESHDARLLSGHASIVLSLDSAAGGRVFVSGSKDHTARIWAHGDRSGSDRTGRWGCVAVCEGHAESVGATAMSRLGGTNGKASLGFMFTGSQDRTIKMWDLSSVPLAFTPTGEAEVLDPPRLKSLTTHRAHDKDINFLDVAPNDRFLASASQDKTVKVFEIEFVVSAGSVRGAIRLLGVCKGHRRGVWSVRFSRTEKVLATGSGDKTVKLWSLEDFSCLKTFEGHTNSVLRVNFINQGRRLLSSASDGLVKLWDVQREECIATMDNHEDKVWALVVSTDESTIISAGADSRVTFWQDSTEEIERENEAKRQGVALREQTLMNYISLHDYRNAILLALAIDHPGRLLSIFRLVHSTADNDKPAGECITGHPAVDQVLKTLPLPPLAKLLVHVRTWNALARTSGIAQVVLHALLKLRPMADIMAAFDSSGNEENLHLLSNTSLLDLIGGILPYTERHLGRVEMLVQDSWVVDFVLGEMNGGLFEDTVATVPVERMDID